ncbi:ankyrin repeat domain-containing protein [Roseobacter sp. MH60115]|uniref:ankyrin repeat domain-containing protein n=1 Tax=Roseobacter sp. MH60115 TaxID=2785324 RepID=UPI0018A2592C|nr:ankyrin repeat domain-containing protein [Roseobacter sp. MH60115]
MKDLIILTKLAIMKEEKSEKEPPDIFHAARNGDIVELNAAIESGQSLSDVDELEKTPLHLAAEYGHEEFVISVLARDKSQVHQLDHYGCRPYDYSEGRSDERAMQALTLAMYPPESTIER